MPGDPYLIGSCLISMLGFLNGEHSKTGELDIFVGTPIFQYPEASFSGAIMFIQKIDVHIFT